MEGPRDPRIEAIVAQYGRLIRHIVHRVGGPSVALVRDDIEQEVIVALWRRLASEQPVEHPASYIYKAAVRETLRAVRRQLASRVEHIDDAAAGARAPASSDPHLALQGRRDGERIRKALSRLAADRRRAVQAHLAGHDVQEVMEMFGWTYQKARNLIARGIADLRQALKEEGLDGGV
jgi:RNA polymerase sigma factor (sigma-70 family)